MKKILTLFLALCLALIGLTACTPEKTPDYDPDSGDVPTGKISIGILPGAPEKQALNSFLAGFTVKYPQIDVTIRTISGEYSQAMQKMISNDDLPDLVWVPVDQHTPYSGDFKAFADLAPYFERDKDEIDLADYNQVVIDSCRLTPDGKELYMAPRDYNRPTCFYNKDMFDRAGVPYPTDDWTWEDFLEICRLLRAAMDKNLDENVGLLRSSYPCEAMLDWDTSYYPMFTGFGGTFIDADGKLTLDTPANVAAIEKFRDLTFRRYSDSPHAAASGVFTGKAAAMVFDTRPSVGKYLQAGINFDFALMPETPGKQLGAGASGFAISAKSEAKELSWLFIKYMMSEEGQQAYGKTGMSVPILNKLIEEGEWKHTIKEGLNHDAFVKEPERDIGLNYYTAFEPKYHSIIKDKITRMILEATNPDDVQEVAAVVKNFQKELSALLRLS